MSLGSRLVNAIFPSQNSSLAPTHGSDDVQTVTFPNGSFKESNTQGRHLEKSKAMEEEAVEGRPPYIHVSCKTTVPIAKN